MLNPILVKQCPLGGASVPHNVEWQTSCLSQMGETLRKDSQPQLLAAQNTLSSKKELQSSPANILINFDKPIRKIKLTLAF